MTQDVAAVRLTNRPPFSIRYLIRGKVGRYLDPLLASDSTYCYSMVVLGTG